MSSSNGQYAHHEDSENDSRQQARERLARRQAARGQGAPVDDEAMDLAGRSRHAGDGEESLFAANRPGSRRAPASNPYRVADNRERSARSNEPQGRPASSQPRRSEASDIQRPHRSSSRSGMGGVDFVMAAISAVSSIPHTVMVCVIAVLVLFSAIIAFSRSCSSSPEIASPVAVQEQQADESDDQPEEEAAVEQADFSNISGLVDSDTMQALQAKADDSRIASIVNNASALGVTGEVYQRKMLELAANDPQAIDYVADFPTSYPAQAGQPYDGQVTKGTIPDLKQWDQRWGYVEYCAGGIGSTGCCPTSLSMVYMGLTGKTDKTPADMAVLATQGGYAVDGEGTIGSFLTDEASELGLSCVRFSPASESLTWYLQNGYAVIVNVGPGDFTDGGHFFVARGVASDGSIQINDPYSSVNTAKTWDADVIVNQSIAMYAFKAL